MPNSTFPFFYHLPVTIENTSHCKKENNGATVAPLFERTSEKLLRTARYKKGTPIGLLSL